MFRTFMCRLLLVAAVCLTGACGSDSDGASGVTGPSGGSSPPSNTSPPPSGVANIAGNWSGRFGFEQNNVKEFANVTTTVQQSDRAVSGTLRFTTAGWEQWTASFSGTLAGTPPDSQFVGAFTVQAPSSTGTGICVAQNTFAGASTTAVMHWEAVSLNFVSNVSTQPASACRGTVTNAVSSLSR